MNIKCSVHKIPWFSIASHKWDCDAWRIAGWEQKCGTDIGIHIRICVDTKYLSLHFLVPEILKLPRSLDTDQKGTRCEKNYVGHFFWQLHRILTLAAPAKLGV